MNLGLAGKTVIVTAATSNIGRAVALAMADEGVNLVAVGRDEKAGKTVVEAAKHAGAKKAVFLSVDLTERDSGERIAKFTEKKFGTVDILINGVGGNNEITHFAESNPDSWQKDIDINLLTVLRVTRAVLPIMIANKHGRIIHIGSTAGIVGDYMLAVYSAAKGAVHSFTKVLAKEVGQHNITVNCVAPYLTMTNDPSTLSSGSRFNPEQGFFTKELGKLNPEDIQKLQRTGPLSRTTGTPEEVAAAVLYLASEQAAFVTGQILPIEGGTLL